MAYEKPELLVLNVAAGAIRGGSGDSTGNSTDAHHKASTVFEGANDGGSGFHTSSSSGAYESDE